MTVILNLDVKMFILDETKKEKSILWDHGYRVTLFSFHFSLKFKL